jgi:hypothetical protein
LFVFSSFGAPVNMAATKKDVRADAQKFIDEYSAMWTKLRYESSQAEWRSNTMISRRRRHEFKGDRRGE